MWGTVGRAGVFPGLAWPVGTCHPRSDCRRLELRSSSGRCSAEQHGHNNKNNNDTVERGTSMRKPELAAAIADKADLTREQANRVLNAVLDEITDALNRKESVTLVGFGTFVQRHRGARTGKNPQTGEPVKIKASNTVAFKPGKSLRDAIN
ncbi:MAG TPA: HU family DNA-binding protein [Pseudomonas sp.]|nr:HU family DNA-binding protein [Pseudomonas sp.]HTO17889.1 HU family DNA-binding protein [Pseudomonas sp.]